MKRIMISCSCLFVFLGNVNAQITVAKDTSFTDVCRGNSVNVKPFITLTNTTNIPQVISWNVDMNLSILPTGYNTSGICFLPGLCYVFNGGVHTETMDTLSSAIIEPAVNVTDSARLDSAQLIVVNLNINGGNQKIYFKITSLACVTSIANTSKANRIQLDMYPIPAKNILNVVHNNNKVAKAILYNVLGKKIMEYYTPANANGFSINTASIPNGMYILDVRDNNNLSLATQRFSKN
jgi:hypothetical protein